MADSILQGVTAARPFLSCNPAKNPLFSVNPGVPAEDVLSMASCLLDDALNAMMAAEGTYPAGAVERLVEMAKAALDAVLDGAMKGGGGVDVD